MINKQKFSVGDIVWFYAPNKIHGTIVKIIPAGELGYTFDHYVIETDTPVDVCLDIRPEFLVFPSKESMR